MFVKVVRLDYAQEYGKMYLLYTIKCRPHHINIPELYTLSIVDGHAACNTSNLLGMGRDVFLVHLSQTFWRYRSWNITSGFRQSVGELFYSNVAISREKNRQIKTTWCMRRREDCKRRLTDFQTLIKYISFDPK